MKINLIEMEGLLRGKCLPGNMMVNESLAEYLVRQFAKLNEQLAESRREFRAANATIHNLEMKVEQVVAENAGLIEAAEFATVPDMWIEQADGMLDYRYIDWYVDVLKAAMETPATDAYLAEVRAQGVEMFASHLRTNDNGASVCKMIALGADEFAAQLRQGAEHE